MRLEALSFDRPKQVHLADWHSRTEPERLRFLRATAEDVSQDPRIKETAVAIISQGGFTARAYEEHAAKLLAWVQANIRYVNEKDEVIQSPLYTLEQKYGDCDDMAALLAALMDSLGYPWAFVLAGRDSAGNVYRWVEGQSRPRSRRFGSPIEWAHIYLCVGWPPFGPAAQWRWADPTLLEPLGYDVIEQGAGPAGIGGGGYAPRGGSGLPELAGWAETPSTGTQQRRNLYEEIAVGSIVGIVSGVASAVLSAVIVKSILHEKMRS